MINFSRRQLAQYAVDEMIAKRPVGDLSAHLAAALLASGRKKEIDLLLADINQELEERGLLANANLISAYPLSEELRHELISQLKKMTNVNEVVLREQVDKTVIGGVKIETAGRSWDKTLLRALAKLKEID